MKKEKAVQAEREFRLSVLRQKNSISTEPTSNKLTLDDNLNENGHINLFYEEEQQLNAGKNEEREEEEKKKKEKFESQFIYSLTGKDKEQPWYSLDKTNKSNDNNKNKNISSLKEKRKDKKRKEIEDPLELIKKNLAKNKEIEQSYKESLSYYQRENKNSNDVINNTDTFVNPTKLLKEFSKKTKSSNSSSSSSSDTSSSESDSSSDSNTHKKRKHSKRHHHHSHHHKHSHKHHKNSKKHSNKKIKKHHEEVKKEKKGISTIEKLREERLKREKEERQRALNINGIPASSLVNKVEEEKYFYNSQFNPDSIRQLNKRK